MIDEYGMLQQLVKPSSMHRERMMTFRYAAVICIFAFGLNTQASDMAIVEAVTGNTQPNISTSSQPKAVSSSINSNRLSEPAYSKFEYTARQKAREMNCETPKNPTVEPLSMGTQVLVFPCQDGRELRLQCASGLGCKPL